MCAYVHVESFEHKWYYCQTFRASYLFEFFASMNLICRYYLCAVKCFVCVVRQFGLIELVNLIKFSVI